MDRADIFATVAELTVDILGVEPDAVVDDARFKEDLDADSLDLVELVMALEEKFDISVPEDELEDVLTVAQAVALVSDKVSARA